MNTTLQKYLPKHFISKLAFIICRCRMRWFKNWLIRAFVRKFGVNTAEVENFSPALYPHFNAFFTRELKAGVRPLAEAQLVSPADGAISECGSIKTGRILQAKGWYYSVESLLTRSADFAHFVTIYLSPKDYHRIHMPVAGRLLETIYVPGELFSVNQKTVQGIPNVFARNERVVNFFDTEYGEMAVVMVGAINVGSMETAWQGLITPPYGQRIQRWDYRDQAITLVQGEYLGHFNMGSTVILLLPEQLALLSALEAGMPLQMGQAISL